MINCNCKETKQKYSLIFDKMFIKPDTQSFALRVNLFKCVQSRHRQEKFLTSRAFTVENILKILKLKRIEIDN